MNHPALSVVIPVYNEAATVAQLIEHVRKAPVEVTMELVVVDDVSSDGTRQILEQIAGAGPGDIRLVVRPANRGKGAGKKITWLDGAAALSFILRDRSFA